jgi:hypothetical protein
MCTVDHKKEAVHATLQEGINRFQESYMALVSYKLQSEVAAEPK